MAKRNLINTLFWIITVMFVILIGFIFIPFDDDLKSTLFPFAGVLALLVLILGLVLFFLVRRAGIKDKWLRRWLMLVGISPAGAVVSSILHNVVDALIRLMGYGEFEEPVFFLLGVIGFPLLFLIGVVGSLVRWRRLGVG